MDNHHGINDTVTSFKQVLIVNNMTWLISVKIRRPNVYNLLIH